MIVLEGCVATYVGVMGFLNNQFTANLPRNLLMRKSVNI